MRRLSLTLIPVIILLFFTGCSGTADKSVHPTETESLMSFVSSFEKESSLHLTVEASLAAGGCRYYLASYDSDEENSKCVFLISVNSRGGELTCSKATADVSVEREHLAPGDSCSFCSFNLDGSFVLFGFTDSRNLKIETSAGNPVHLLDSGIYYVISDDDNISLNVL